jgi:drug/metabolite transporter (DMT)-like permease
MSLRSGQVKGIHAALTSAIFMGLTPVFGKLAISHGMPPLAVVGLRTIFAAALLFMAVLAFKRSFLYIYPAGLLGCFLAGGINGAGSLLFYIALGRIDASLGQMIFSLYPLFVALWGWLDNQPPSRMAVTRLLMVPPAMFLLTKTAGSAIDPLGIMLMLGASALYALHLPINQRVLYDMPAPTVTLYTLLSMSIVVTPAIFFSGFQTAQLPTAWSALAGLTLVTFLARITLFLGVKHLGGLQTSLLGLGEVLITVIFSYAMLGERLSIYQWIGAMILVLSLTLVRVDQMPQHRRRVGGWLGWLRPPGVPRDIPW